MCVLVQMLWTFGRFGYQDQFLMDMMHEIATKLQADCNSKALADVVYAMAQLGWADARLHTLVAEYAMDNIQVSTRHAADALPGVESVLVPCPAGSSLRGYLRQHVNSIKSGIYI
jgi:hypothetical protein